MQIQVRCFKRLPRSSLKLPPESHRGDDRAHSCRPGRTGWRRDDVGGALGRRVVEAGGPVYTGGSSSPSHWRGIRLGEEGGPLRESNFLGATHTLPQFTSLASSSIASNKPPISTGPTSSRSPTPHSQPNFMPSSLRNLLQMSWTQSSPSSPSPRLRKRLALTRGEIPSICI